MRLKTRFMKLYKLFRLKKYGEPIGPVIEQRIPKVKQQQLMMSPKKQKSLLNVVHEEEHSEHDSDEQEEREVSDNNLHFQAGSNG